MPALDITSLSSASAYGGSASSALESNTFAPGLTPHLTPPLTTVVKRDGRTVPYDRNRIAHAIEMAFRAEAGAPYPDPLDATICDDVESVTDAVEVALAAMHTTMQHALHHSGTHGEASIEAIQDEVERALMTAGHFPVARRYIVYREARAQRRQGLRLRIRNADGSTSVLEATVLRSIMLDAARDLGPDVDAAAVYQETIAAVYDGISRAELAKASILAARSRMERAPEYTYLAARLLLGEVYTELSDAR